MTLLHPSSADKSTCRRMMRERLRQAVPADRDELSRRVTERVLHQPWFEAAAAVGVYCALKSEVPMDSVIHAAWQSGKKVAVPIRTRTCTDYQWGLINPDTGWDTGPDGVLQPAVCTPCVADALDVIFVPGLAFTKSGVRLGRGGGHYDRLLALSPRAVKVGMALTWQLIEEIPVEPHDVHMHVIVTDQWLYKIPGD